MQKLSFTKSATGPLNILCLGAHCDDIEIGCGGTILRLARERSEGISVYWLVFCSKPAREQEARKCANLFLKDVREKTIDIRKFRDGFLPAQWAEVKEVFEDIKNVFNPDLVFTHYRDDRHQDHRVVSDLAWNTYRDHMILEYEVPKYDGDLGSPNVFVELARELCDEKIKYTLETYVSQREKHWFTADTLQAMLRLRGVESSSGIQYAEGFYGRKLLL